MSEPLYLAKSEDGYPALLPQMANRHGLVTGATGTGKTVTLQSMAERLSFAGVPVFMADVKGDLSGMGAAGVVTPKLEARLKDLGLEGFAPYANPVAFWDVFGENGIPVRATISDMGPLLLARLLNLNDTQTGVLQLVFKIADDQGLLLLDLKDLRAMVQHVGDNAKNFTTEYGNVAPASIGAIQRGLLMLEEQGGDIFFGEPMLDIHDLMKTDENGRGVINVLAAEKLVQSPALYSTFLLWLLAELFEQLPEAGDLDKPKLVFFFDEAHLLFKDAPKALVEKIEQVVRLIRSKGVGVYFVTQNPLDVPETVLAQLGNRVQHALRAFTPRDQRAVKAAATTFRQNPKLDTEEVITQLGKGEALISMLEGNGVPSIVERTLICPPFARIGPVSEQERRQILAKSPFRGKYDETIDSESAYEILQKRAQKKLQEAEQAEQAQQAETGGLGGLLGSILGGGSAPAPRGRGRAPMSTTEVIIKNASSSLARSVGTQIGRAIMRGVLGGLGRR